MLTKGHEHAIMDCKNLGLELNKVIAKKNVSDHRLSSIRNASVWTRIRWIFTGVK